MDRLKVDSNAFEEWGVYAPQIERERSEHSFIHMFQENLGSFRLLCLSQELRFAFD
jgi:hypothetical protein